MIGGTLALTHRRLHHFVLAVLMTALALRSARALPLAALLLLPIANATITNRQPRRPSQVGLPTRPICVRWIPLQRTGPGSARSAAAFALLRHAPTGFPPDQFPVQAYAQIPADAASSLPTSSAGTDLRSTAPSGFLDGAAISMAQVPEAVRPPRPGPAGWWEYWQSSTSRTRSCPTITLWSQR